MSVMVPGDEVRGTRDLTYLWLAASVVGLTVGGILWLSGSHDAGDTAWAVTTWIGLVPLTWTTILGLIRREAGVSGHRFEDPGLPEVWRPAPGRGPGQKRRDGDPHRLEAATLRASPDLDHDRSLWLCDPSRLPQRCDHVRREEEGVEPGDEIE